jgi:predicted metalloprotease with PDZ domain
MAHCWIPKRVYGVGYLPFNWELPPVIDTIWFNEGFARYATIDALAEAMPADEAAEFRGRQLARLRTIVDDAPSFIREMPLLVLSREASFIYSRDFRIGSNIFARGALMAAEIDWRIRERTGGKKTLRDALRYLLQWSAEQRRPFTVEEFPDLLARGSGVDVREVIERWMKPAAVQ